MELLLISQNKIRISLTKDDLDGYRITCDKIDYGSTETRRVFWSIFDEVKQKTGFDAAERRIFIQIYPDSLGGCEMYVSKINAPQNAETESESSYVTFSERETPTAVREIYVFHEIDTLLSACRQLIQLGYEAPSSAYADKRGRFYLSVEPDTSQIYHLTEYGSRHTSEKVRFYISEHCKAICGENAVKTLGTL